MNLRQGRAHFARPFLLLPLPFAASRCWEGPGRILYTFRRDRHHRLVGTNEANIIKQRTSWRKIRKVHRGLRGLVLAMACALAACGGGAVFIGDGFGATVNVPPPGGNGDEVLSVVSAEPAGGNCNRGGSRVDSGIDANRNGVLETREVSTTRYVCEGQTRMTRTGVAAGKGGPDVLVSLTNEPAGAHCAMGGQKIEAGADHDADDALSAVEVTSSSYLCNP